MDQQATTTKARRLGKGWHIAFSDKHQRYYYFNVLTGTRTWSEPDEVREKRRRASSSTSVTSRWTKHYDPKYKRHFYYNKDTGESSWTYPETKAKNEKVRDELFSRALSSKSIGVDDTEEDHDPERPLESPSSEGFVAIDNALSSPVEDDDEEEEIIQDDLLRLAIANAMETPESRIFRASSDDSGYDGVDSEVDDSTAEKDQEVSDTTVLQASAGSKEETAETGVQGANENEQDRQSHAVTTTRAKASSSSNKNDDYFEFDDKRVGSSIRERIKKLKVVSNRSLVRSRRDSVEKLEGLLPAESGTDSEHDDQKPDRSSSEAPVVTMSEALVEVSSPSEVVPPPSPPTPPQFTAKPPVVESSPRSRSASLRRAIDKFSSNYSSSDNLHLERADDDGGWTSEEEDQSEDDHEYIDGVSNSRQKQAHVKDGGETWSTFLESGQQYLDDDAQNKQSDLLPGHIFKQTTESRVTGIESLEAYLNLLETEINQNIS